jgi:hypothetical protein
VAQFNRLPRAILLSISELSGETYRDVGWEELKAELERRGLTPTDAVLGRAMRALKGEGYLDAYFSSGHFANLIRLDGAGRKEVEGWPAVPGSVSSSDVEELVSVLQTRGEDGDLPETERSKARAAAGAVRDLGVSVTAEVIAAWLKGIGVG